MALHGEPLDIPLCDVDQDEHGVIHLRHHASGDTATATTEQDAVIQGVILRVSAGYAREIPFTTGDMP
ncbi:hypothetical protein [Nonomuraea lactucae]|uniref:hypothetical protein n=1 Tax=Nonomuraea lactucae TaxID=2249762 RepID=UPI000DE54593|nr:hypothetical protein [Nonomuraea lactucae]